MHSASTVRSLPTSDLLAILIGDDEVASTLARRPLVEFFALRPSGATVLREGETPCGAIRIIDAAKELISRALLEQVSQGDCLGTPQAVRDYLRLLLAGKEHEVFVIILLDAQNRSFYCDELFRGTLTQASVCPREIVSTNAAMPTPAASSTAGCSIALGRPA